MTRKEASQILWHVNTDSAQKVTIIRQDHAIIADPDLLSDQGILRGSRHGDYYFDTDKLKEIKNGQWLIPTNFQIRAIASEGKHAPNGRIRIGVKALAELLEVATHDPQLLAEKLAWLGAEAVGEGIKKMRLFRGLEMEEQLEFKLTNLNSYGKGSQMVVYSDHAAKLPGNSLEASPASTARSGGMGM